MPIIERKNKILKLFEKKSSIGLDFYYSSRNVPKIFSNIVSDSKKITNSTEFKQQSSNHYKEYPYKEKIKLHSNFTNSTLDLFNVIKNRKSIRYFDENLCMDLNSLSNILLLSYGLNGRESIDKNNKIKYSYRTVPSAGALYPLEIYPIIFNIKGIIPGIYHYNVKKFSLEKLKEGNFLTEISEIYHGAIFDHTNVLLIITGIFRRTIKKYKMRGWRLIFLDAGHLGQNLYLTSTAMGIGCTTLGAGYDHLVARLLGIDGIREGLVYSACLGIPKEYK